MAEDYGFELTLARLAPRQAQELHRRALKAMTLESVLCENAVFEAHVAFVSDQLSFADHAEIAVLRRLHNEVIAEKSEERYGRFAASAGMMLTGASVFAAAMVTHTAWVMALVLLLAALATVSVTGRRTGVRLARMTCETFGLTGGFSMVAIVGLLVLILAAGLRGCG